MEEIYRLYEESYLQSCLMLYKGKQMLSRKALNEQGAQQHYLMLWNTGCERAIWIDGIEYHFPSNHFLCLMVYQSFEMIDAHEVIVWRFNREFYCVRDHDHEVSCIGLLFYGTKGVFFIRLEEAEQHKFLLLYQVFIDEFDTRDNIQGEMLRMLLKRLIIKLTRLTRQQQLAQYWEESELNIVRQLNVLVEQHFRQLHQVQDYAEMLHKSPKTLANLFARYNAKSPREVIQERLALEARRLLIYTDKSISEIGYELGFEEVSHFSRFFKTCVGSSPQDFKNNARQEMLRLAHYRQLP